MTHAASRIIDLMGSRRRCLIAIDGMAASGKTTLAAELAAMLDGCHVVHMDDFTLPFEDRFPGYFDKTLSNADIGRFDREVLTPLLSGKSACYRPYVCHPVPGFLPPVTIPANFACVIVEGAYCLHPQLSGRYDLRILSTVSRETQRARILARNGSAQLERFETLWIPMENRHILEHGLAGCCDLLLSEA